MGPAFGADDTEEALGELGCKFGPSEIREDEKWLEDIVEV